jgi:hypothetical protein
MGKERRLTQVLHYYGAHLLSSDQIACNPVMASDLFTMGQQFGGEAMLS